MPSNRDMARGIVPSEDSEQSVHLTDQIEEVQKHLLTYYETLSADLEFDVKKAQRAEQYAIRKLDKLNHHPKIRSRDLRINTQCITRFRQRTHASLVRIAEIQRARELERRLAEEAKLAAAEEETKQQQAAHAAAAAQVVQINFEKQPVQDTELYEALDVLESSGIVSPQLKEKVNGRGPDFAVTGENTEGEEESAAAEEDVVEVARDEEVKEL